MRPRHLTPTGTLIESKGDGNDRINSNNEPNWLTDTLKSESAPLGEPGFCLTSSSSYWHLGYHYFYISIREYDNGSPGYDEVRSAHAQHSPSTPASSPGVAALRPARR